MQRVRNVHASTNRILTELIQPAHAVYKGVSLQWGCRNLWTDWGMLWDILVKVAYDVSVIIPSVMKIGS
jgi:hypothetical protein